MKEIWLLIDGGQHEILKLSPTKLIAQFPQLKSFYKKKAWRQKQIDKAASQINDTKDKASRAEKLVLVDHSTLPFDPGVFKVQLPKLHYDFLIIATGGGGSQLGVTRHAFGEQQQDFLHLPSRVFNNQVDFDFERCFGARAPDSVLLKKIGIIMEQVLRHRWFRDQKPPSIKNHVPWPVLVVTEVNEMRHGDLDELD